jgi:hypothetical protein
MALATSILCVGSVLVVNATRAGAAIQRLTADQIAAKSWTCQGVDSPLTYPAYGYYFDTYLDGPVVYVTLHGSDMTDEPFPNIAGTTTLWWKPVSLAPGHTLADWDAQTSGGGSQPWVRSTTGYAAPRDTIEGLDDFRIPENGGNLYANGVDVTKDNVADGVWRDNETLTVYTLNQLPRQTLNGTPMFPGTYDVLLEVRPADDGFPSPHELLQPDLTLEFTFTLGAPNAGGDAQCALSGWNEGPNQTSTGPIKVNLGGPDITSLSPNTGSTAGGTYVDIQGAGFTGTSSVWFGDLQSPQFTVVSDSEIKAHTPPGGAGPATVSVVGPFAEDPGDSGSGTMFFTYTPEPTAPNITWGPTSGPSYAPHVVSIRGSGLTNYPEIYVGGQPVIQNAGALPGAHILTYTDNVIRFTMPWHDPGKIGIELVDKTLRRFIVGTYTFVGQYKPLPRVYGPADGWSTYVGLSPNSGHGGTAVAIAGYNLDTVTSVKFGHALIPASGIMHVRKTLIIVVAPPAARPGLVTVWLKNAAGKSFKKDTNAYFVYLAA